jgi:hypothetical protein
LVPDLDGPIYKGIFTDICPLLSAPNFPIMIDPISYFNGSSVIVTKLTINDSSYDHHVIHAAKYNIALMKDVFSKINITLQNIPIVYQWTPATVARAV